MAYDNVSAKPYHALDRIGTGDTHYTYDGAGNLTGKTVNTPSVQTTNYSYDPENHLTQVVTGGVTVRFYYDGDGQLIKKVVGTKTTVYIGGYFEYSEDNGGPGGDAQGVQPGEPAGGGAGEQRPGEVHVLGPSRQYLADAGQRDNE
jgi:YD repeat-containing protein